METTVLGTWPSLVSPRSNGRIWGNLEGLMQFSSEHQPSSEAKSKGQRYRQARESFLRAILETEIEEGRTYFDLAVNAAIETFKKADPYNRYRLAIELINAFGFKTTNESDWRHFDRL